MIKTITNIALCAIIYFSVGIISFYFGRSSVVCQELKQVQSIEKTIDEFIASHRKLLPELVKYGYECRDSEIDIKECLEKISPAKRAQK